MENNKIIRVVELAVGTGLIVLSTPIFISSLRSKKYIMTVVSSVGILFGMWVQYDAISKYPSQTKTV